MCGSFLNKIEMIWYHTVMPEKRKKENHKVEMEYCEARIKKELEKFGYSGFSIKLTWPKKIPVITIIIPERNLSNTFVFSSRVGESVGRVCNLETGRRKNDIVVILKDFPNVMLD